MKTDVIVIGSELDALVSAIRLSEHGCSVRLLGTGLGSLNYSSGGIHVLGYFPETNHPITGNPLAEISKLPVGHPYRKLGEKQVGDALIWFSETVEGFGDGKPFSRQNADAVTPAGKKMPVFECTPFQATFGKLGDQPIDIVHFRGHRDFPAEMLKQGLAEAGMVANLVEVDAPDRATNSLSIAMALDGLKDLNGYFSAQESNLSAKSKTVLFPSVLGFARPGAVVKAAEQNLARTCLEVPTLPTSVFGKRLEETLHRMLQQRKVCVQSGSRPSADKNGNGSTLMLRDTYGRPYEASAVVLATGGVMMGGLEVLSSGIVHEPTFGLETFQGAPLSSHSIEGSVDALHVSGVEADDLLRARLDGAGPCQNIFVTGRSLAHWNPAAEASGEGVAIATGWAAANNVIKYLEGHCHG